MMQFYKYVEQLSLERIRHIVTFFESSGKNEV